MELPNVNDGDLDQLAEDLLGDNDKSDDEPLINLVTNKEHKR